MLKYSIPELVNRTWKKNDVLNIEKNTEYYYKNSARLNTIVWK